MPLVGLNYDPSTGLDAGAVYAELRKLVAEMGAKVGVQEPEDFAQEFFTTAIRNGWFERFDATKGRSMRTYVLEMVRLRRQDARRNQDRRFAKVLPVAFSADRTPDEGFDVVGATTDPDPAVELDTRIELLATVRNVVRDMPRTAGAVSTGDLFAEMARRAADLEDLSDTALARHFGISQTRLREVKQKLAETPQVMECLAS